MWEKKRWSENKSNVTRMNTSLPSMSTSPIFIRQHDRVDQSVNHSVLSGTGPLLSSPFIPHIKRALGLESHTQSKHSNMRRLVLGEGQLPVATTATTEFLPHVKLNKTRRISLTDKNSSMMNRSSTVKIAPPAIAKIASPNLYQIRKVSTPITDKNTLDTCAVVTALKERRKRSIPSEDICTEIPTHQLKRRRQESQHSNASTSSIPAMPESFPDFRSTDFSIRLNSTSLKRPSRPSQEDWEQEQNVKRQCCEVRNNSILSSLSSSKRFMATQQSKRKANTSFNKEDTTVMVNTQKQEPAKLTHLNVDLDTISPCPKLTQFPGSVNSPLSNGQKENMPTNGVIDKSTPTTEMSRQATLKAIPSMKKTTSIYSGLSSFTNFKKAQYANVVATLEDYDLDMDAEQERVEQMLNCSFSNKQEKSTELKTGELSGTPTAVSVTLMVSSAPISVAVVTSSLAMTVAASSSPLQALEKLSKSPIQETGGRSDVTKVEIMAPNFQLFGSNSTSESSLQTDSKNLTPAADARGFTMSTSQANTFPQSNTGVLGVATRTATPATSTMTDSVGTCCSPVTATKTVTTTVVSNPSTDLFGANTSAASPKSAGFSFGNAISSAVTTTASATPVTTAAGARFSFGHSQCSATTSEFGFSMTPSSAAPVTTVTSGFGFGMTPSSAAPATTVASSGFGFGMTPSSVAPATSVVSSGFGFGMTPSSSAPVTTVSSGFGFGMTPSSAAMVAPSGFGFGMTPSSAAMVAPSGFGFGMTPSSAASTTTVASSGFGFGMTPSSTAPATTVASSGFGFGMAPSSAAPATVASSGFGFGMTPSSAAPATTVASSGFGFGMTPSSTAPATTVASSGFGFGMTPSSAAPATTVASSGFGFGMAPSSAAQMSSSLSSGFSFGSTSIPAVTKPPTGGFSFNPTSSLGASSSAAPGLSFSSVPTATAFSGSTNVNKPSSRFHVDAQPNITSAPAGMFSGGLSANSGPAMTTPVTGFSFEAKSMTPLSIFGILASSVAANTFGTPATNTTANLFTAQSTGITQNLYGSSAFSGGASPFSLGTAKTTASSTPFTFSAVSSTLSTDISLFPTVPQVTTAAGSGFGFGQSATTQPPSASLFQFGCTGSKPLQSPFGTTTTQSSGVFGSSNMTSGFNFGSSSNQLPAFGASTNQQPAFGASTNQQPAFGASTTQQSAFGASTNQQLAFGASTNQQPAFGASTNQQPAFGASTQKSAFGASANQQPAFGASTQKSAFGASANQQPAFGASTNQQLVFGASSSNQFSFGEASRQHNVFGTSANQLAAFQGSTNQQQAFGGTTNQQPVLGSATPTFGTTANTTGSVNFAAAPNVNPFAQGQTTPANSTGNAFGQINSISSAQQGFNFTGTSQGTAGFNFSALQTPTFGTPGVTANTVAFSLGTGDTNNRTNRVLPRSRRQHLRR